MLNGVTKFPRATAAAVEEKRIGEAALQAAKAGRAAEKAQRRLDVAAAKVARAERVSTMDQFARSPEIRTLVKLLKGELGRNFLVSQGLVKDRHALVLNDEVALTRAGPTRVDENSHMTTTYSDGDESTYPEFTRKFRPLHEVTESECRARSCWDILRHVEETSKLPEEAIVRRRKY